MPILTVASIKKEAGEYDVEVIQRLRIERAGLTQLAPALDGCSSLLELSLSGNQLSRIEGLSTLQRLQRLDLSHNKIKRIDNLEGLTVLRRLDIRGNLISLSTDLAGLAACPTLTHLYLRLTNGTTPDEVAANPVCEELNYVSSVRRIARALDFLDGESLRLKALVAEALEGLEVTPLAQLPSENWLTPAASEPPLSPSATATAANADARACCAPVPPPLWNDEGTSTGGGAGSGGTDAALADLRDALRDLSAAERSAVAAARDCVAASHITDLGHQ